MESVNSLLGLNSKNVGLVSKLKLARPRPRPELGRSYEIIIPFVHFKNCFYQPGSGRDEDHEKMDCLHARKIRLNPVRGKVREISSTNWTFSWIAGWYH
jgi:hypothetical protein